MRGRGRGIQRVQISVVLLIAVTVGASAGAWGLGAGLVVQRDTASIALGGEHGLETALSTVGGTSVLPSQLLLDAVTPQTAHAKTLTSPRAQAAGQFGTSVGISGTTIVVGAALETASGDYEAGHAYTFNATTDKRISTLTSPNVQFSGYFGWSAAISGSTVVVGAPYETASGYTGAGHAYLFNATTGHRIATLTSPNAQTYGYFGWSVAINGTTVVVGAYGEEVSGQDNAGHAYTFNAKTGKLIATLTSPNAHLFGYFGWSVAISSTTVAVGAYGEEASGLGGAGHVYTFKPKSGALIATFVSPNAQTLGYFGHSVALNGTTLVVGANGESSSGLSAAGNAYTFNAETGKLYATLTSPNALSGGYFGYSVAISGTRVVVGALGEYVAPQSGAGHAYTFTAKTGKLIATLTSRNPIANGAFGWSVAINGTTVVVGAIGETAKELGGAGHAYVF